MVWSLRRSSLIIPAELHEQLSKSCKPIDEVPSEIVSVRNLSRKRRESGKTIRESEARK
jgi:hypothetical protein